MFYKKYLQVGLNPCTESVDAQTAVVRCPAFDARLRPAPHTMS